MRQERQSDFSELAGEYVLGSLTGDARERLEQQLADDYALQAEVDAWEQRLAPLLEAVDPVDPPSDLWSRIQQRIDPPEPATKGGLWESLNFWRGMALVTLSLVLGVTLSLLTLRPITVDADRMMVVMNDQSQAGWIVEAGPHESMLYVSALHPTQLSGDRVCQLWVEAEPGRLVPLGILPHKGKRFIRPPVEIKPDSRFLVTIEPARSAPVERPSNQVVFEGRLTAI